MKQLNKDDTFLARWLNGELSEEELKAFEASDDFPVYQKIAAESSRLSTPAWNKSEMLDNIMQSDKSEINTNQTSRRRMLWPLMAAASFALLMAYVFLLRPGNDIITFASLPGEKTEIKLPDGSLVFLNADSEVDFSEKNFINSRKLNLQGEAFFEVEEGSTFDVVTESGTVRVLGTSFNVAAREANLQVDCYTGKVGFLRNNKTEEILLPGNGLKMNRDNKIEKYIFETGSSTPDWRQGNSRFSNAAFQDVIDELERQFDIKIEAAQTLLDIKNYNGGFEHDNLKKALDIICSSVDCNYTIENKNVKLASN